MEKTGMGIALLPRKPAVSEINEYVEILASAYPQAKIIIATGERPNENMDILHKNPHISIIHTTKEPLDVVAGGYCLLAAARALEIPWLFINAGMKRYSAPIFCNFIRNSSEYLRFSQFIHGIPPIFRPQTATLDDISVVEARGEPRHRLLVDLFLNYALSTALDIGFTNMSAGMFAVKREAIKYLLNVADYDDSSLLCAQMLWHLKQDKERFTIKTVSVDNINIRELGFNFEKAAREIAFVLSERGKIGRWKTLNDLVTSFFAERESWNRWVTCGDEEFFRTNIIPSVEKILNSK